MAPPVKFASLRDAFDDGIRRAAERDCWEWQKETRDGYGVIWFRQGRISAHRFAYEEFVGPIPEGLGVLHRCDNRRCCNPAHLFMGTPADNAHDRDAKERQARGSRSGASPLTEDDVRNIRRRPYAVLRELAEEYGVSLQAIHAIRKRRTWKHLAD